MAVQWGRAGKAAAVAAATIVGGLTLGWLALIGVVILAIGFGGCEVDLEWSMTDDDEDPALERAIADCDLAAMEAELEKGTDQFDGGAFELFGGEAPAMEDAVACGPKAAALLTRYAVGNDGGDVVLQAAVSTGDPVLVTAVLDAGADVDGRDDAGDTALLDAATDGEADLVEVLLARGADPDAANEAGHVPLIRAVGLRHPDVVAALLVGGAATEPELSVTSVDLLFALLAAGEDGAGEGSSDPDAVLDRALEAFGAERDPAEGAPDVLGTARPLFIAAALGDAESVQLLLAAGADPLAPGGAAGNLPVDAARIMGHKDVVALLGG